MLWLMFLTILDTFRRSHGWCTKDPKILRIQTDSNNTYNKSLYLDEHWLISRQRNSNYYFWNVNEQKSHIIAGSSKDLTNSALKVAIFDSPEYHLPTLIAISDNTTRICDFNEPNVMRSLSKGWNCNYVATVSRTRFISGRGMTLYYT